MSEGANKRSAEGPSDSEAAGAAVAADAPDAKRRKVDQDGGAESDSGDSSDSSDSSDSGSESSEAETGEKTSSAKNGTGGDSRTDGEKKRASKRAEVDISKMTELERENYLFEQREREQREKEVQAIKEMGRKKTQQKKGDSSEEEMDSESSSSSSSSEDEDDDDDYEDPSNKRKAKLKAKPKGKRKLASKRRGSSALRRRRKRSSDASDSDEDSESGVSEDDDEFGDTSVKNVKKKLSSKGRRRQGGSSPTAMEMEIDEVEEDPSQLEPVELPDIIKMQLTRDVLLKWIDEPYVDRAVIGGFVRLLIGVGRAGRTYRVCQVVRLEEVADYRMDGVYVDKKLVVKFADSERAWKFDRVSNSPFTQSEFNFWMQSMMEAKMWPKKTPKKRDVKLWQKHIKREVTDYALTEADIKAKIEKNRRRRKRHVPANLAAEITRMEQDLRLAKSDKNEKEGREIETRLLELRQMQRDRQKKVYQKFVTAAAINARNAKENRIAKPSTSAEQVSADGSVVWNPFARKPTMPNNLWSTITSTDEAAAAEEGQDGSERVRGSNRATNGDGGKESLAQNQASNDFSEALGFDAKRIGRRAENNSNRVVQAKVTMDPLDDGDAAMKDSSTSSGKKKKKKKKSTKGLFGVIRKSKSGKAMSLDDYLRRVAN